ncbi:hypothetical protein DL93DRAFT_2069663 [Clavulina sp. PMI_390]|nr:hypothetical protein DL93DRAFT_2069663 [Clavulina sp. PMI_390]
MLRSWGRASPISARANSSGGILSLTSGAQLFSCAIFRPAATFSKGTLTREPVPSQARYFIVADPNVLVRRAVTVQQVFSLGRHRSASWELGDFAEVKQA